MNTHNDLERKLGRELHDRADGMGGAHVGFADVKGRAQKIRRNRRIAAGAGLAAAVAIIVPGVITASGMLNSQREIDPAPSPEPAPVQIARTTLTLDGIEPGDAPAVEYFTPDGVVLPGKGLQPLDVSYQALVPSAADDGWIAFGPARDRVFYLTDDFEYDGEAGPNYAFIASPDRSLVAFAGTQALQLHSTTASADDRAWDFPKSSAITPVGFLGPDRVAYDVLTLDSGHDLGIAEPDGSFTELGDFASLRSASPEAGLIAVDTRANEDGTVCGGVVDPDASLTEPVWETCDYRLGAFSPDGRYVMASSAYGDGFGLNELEVLDAETGDLVARFTQTSRGQIALVHPVWESADSIVAVAAEGESQSIIRLGVDGSLEEAVEPVEGFYGDLYFYFGADRTKL